MKVADEDERSGNGDEPRHSNTYSETAGQHQEGQRGSSNGQELARSNASDITVPRVGTAVSVLTPKLNTEHNAKEISKSASRDKLQFGKDLAESGSLNGSARKPRSRIGQLYHRSPSGRIIVRNASARQVDAETRETKITTGDEDGKDDDVTWGQVFRSCCCHSAREWAAIGLFTLLLLTVLYCFLVGLDLLSTGFKVAQGCTAGSLLGSDTNPLASLLIGIIATALLQSSSTTTAIVVSLVSGGLDVDQGIYIVMGANVGTSVTAMLVSLAHTRDGEELERAFAGSAVYFIFNVLTAIVLLPLEVGAKYLHRLTKTMLPSSVGEEGDSWEGPIRTIVQPVVRTLIIADKDLIADISTGEVESCSSLYPVYCIDGIESYETCNRTGLIGCNIDTGKCPAFFQDGASKKDDMVSAYVCLLVGLFLLIICLIALVALLHHVLAGASVPIIYKATSINPLFAIAIGCGVTVLVQSSSITTSTLVPLCGVGILPLENLYPLVLGADIGTTVTALMAALVSAKVESLQIALAHLFFNVTGIFMWYPIPVLRRFVLRLARLLGRATRHWRGFPVVFICLSFFGIPLFLLGVSSCFEQHTKGSTALGTFLVLVFGIAAAYSWFWWTFCDGKAKCNECIEKRQRSAAALRALADDMDFVKVDLEWCRNEIGRIKDFAGHFQIVSTHPQVGEEGGGPTLRLLADAGRTQPASLEDELVSLYESCHSMPWRDVLQMASGSIRASLEGSAKAPI